MPTEQEPTAPAVHPIWSIDVSLGGHHGKGERKTYKFGQLVSDPVNREGWELFAKEWPPKDTKPYSDWANGLEIRLRHINKVLDELKWLQADYKNTGKKIFGPMIQVLNHEQEILIGEKCGELVYRVRDIKTGRSLGKFKASLQERPGLIRLAKNAVGKNWSHQFGLAILELEERFFRLTSACKIRPNEADAIRFILNFLKAIGRDKVEYDIRPLAETDIRAFLSRHKDRPGLKSMKVIQAAHDHLNKNK